MSEQITDYRKVIGQNIKVALRNRGKNQVWLADELDMHTSQVSSYTTGGAMPNPQLFAKIAGKLNMTVEELLCKQRPPSEKKEEMDYESKDDDLDEESLLNSLDEAVEKISLERELKAECQSISNYAKTMKESTSNQKIQSLSNLIYNKAIFIKENI